MSTIKFVPMEFFAQFALTQMRRLQARGAVGAAFSGAGRGWWAQVAVCTAFPARGAYCERWALSARLSGSGNIVGGRGALFADAEAPFARLFRVRGRRWWAQVAVCTAFPARGAYCERWALSARLSGSGAGLAIVGSPFGGFHGSRSIVFRREALFADAEVPFARLFGVRGRRWWAQVAVCGRWGAACGRWSPFAQLFQARGSAAPSCARPRPATAAHDACRSACPLAARTHPSSMVRARRLPVGRTPPPFRAAHGACRSACPLAARPPPFRRAACRFAA